MTAGISAHRCGVALSRILWPSLIWSCSILLQLKSRYQHLFTSSHASRILSRLANMNQIVPVSRSSAPSLAQVHQIQGGATTLLTSPSCNCKSNPEPPPPPQQSPDVHGDILMQNDPKFCIVIERIKFASI